MENIETGEMKHRFYDNSDYFIFNFLVNGLYALNKLRDQLKLVNIVENAFQDRPDTK